MVEKSIRLLSNGELKEQEEPLCVADLRRGREEALGFLLSRRRHVIRAGVQVLRLYV